MTEITNGGGGGSYVIPSNAALVVQETDYSSIVRRFVEDTGVLAFIEPVMSLDEMLDYVLGRLNL